MTGTLEELAIKDIAVKKEVAILHSVLDRKCNMRLVNIKPSEYLCCFLIQKDYFNIDLESGYTDLIYCCDTLGGKGDASGLYRGKWLAD